MTWTNQSLHEEKNNRSYQIMHAKFLQFTSSYKKNFQISSHSQPSILTLQNIICHEISWPLLFSKLMQGPSRKKLKILNFSPMIAIQRNTSQDTTFQLRYLQQNHCSIALTIHFYSIVGLDQWSWFWPLTTPSTTHIYIHILIISYS